ncbi:signal peptidase II [Jannaschia rubra]|uniref:signal peptidase II n=1 Tax=Jannaschia rubra TaxID=282197 RepID=UPI00248FFEDB|nr:signal peptidase II [Jannaschia rubra]
MRTVWTAAILAFAVDQLSKLILVQWMDLATAGPFPVLPPYLVFTMGWNEGINFGLLSQSHDLTRWIFVALAVVVSAALLRWSRRFRRPIAQVGAGLVVGGALANALDRVIYGAVADYLNMSCCGIVNPYVFNLADVFIFAGAIALVLWADEPGKTGGAKTP